MYVVHPLIEPSSRWSLEMRPHSGPTCPVNRYLIHGGVVLHTSIGIPTRNVDGMSI